LGSISKMVSGASHIVVLTECGKLYGMGVNGHGQLGIGSRDTKKEFTLITNSSFDEKKVKEIAAGVQHTLILTDDGCVFVFGRNESGQLGLGHKQIILTPVQISIGVPVTDIFGLNLPLEISDLVEEPLLDPSHEVIHENLELSLPRAPAQTIIEEPQSLNFPVLRTNQTNIRIKNENNSDLLQEFIKCVQENTIQLQEQAKLINNLQSQIDLLHQNHLKEIHELKEKINQQALIIQHLHNQ